MNTIQLNYRFDGAGPPLLLLHPVGLDLTFFDPLVAELAPHYRVLRVDMRGHGHTPPAHRQAPRLIDYANDVVAMMRQLSHTPAAVVGFSFGGMIAQELALNYPDHVNALVASACPAEFSEEMRKILRARGSVADRIVIADALNATMQRWFTPEFRGRGGDAAVRQRLLNNDVESWNRAWRAIAELNTAPRLRNIQMPTLCLGAEHDVATPPLIVEELAKKIPGAVFSVVRDAPHMLFIEQPRQTGVVILKFLRDDMTNLVA